MALPTFEDAKNLSHEKLIDLLITKIRIERRSLGLSQTQFAERCGISVRTYKRFELGESNSLESFLKIIIAFERVVALELLFPPKQVNVKPRTPMGMLERTKARLNIR